MNTFKVTSAKIGSRMMSPDGDIFRMFGRIEIKDIFSNMVSADFFAEVHRDKVAKDFSDFSYHLIESSLRSTFDIDRVGGFSAILSECRWADAAAEEVQKDMERQFIMKNNKEIEDAMNKMSEIASSVGSLPIRTEMERFVKKIRQIQNDHDNDFGM